jgi:hypothetical protein
MNDQLFIPTKIKVGYQKRDDTYTKKLAYVIYYDAKGVLRKEKSWLGWCDSKLGSHEYENKPFSGFILNKDVKRSSEWFGDGRNMIRIYDERGIEFEITTGNLLFILMTTNCHKRGLEGEFVYAWQGTELVLLPTGCEEYSACVNFTDLQAKKIAAKTLIQGASYKTKDMRNLTYLGRFDYHTFGSPSRNSADAKSYKEFSERKYRDRSNWTEFDYTYKISDASKMHIFLNEENKYVVTAGLTSLATLNTDIPVSNLADLQNDFYKSRWGTKVIGFEEDNANVKFRPASHWKEKTEVTGKFFKKIADNTYENYRVDEEYEQPYDHKTGKSTYIHKGFKIFKYNTVKLVDGVLKEIHTETNYSYSDIRKDKKLYTKEQIENYGFVDLKIVLESGKKFSYEKYTDYYY